MASLILYSTVGCHLCEQAQGLVYATLGRTVPEVDIADDDGLLERYGVRIPVLKRTDTGDEIGWPFQAREIRLLAGMDGAGDSGDALEAPLDKGGLVGRG